MELFDNFIDPGLKFVKRKATQGMKAVSNTPIPTCTCTRIPYALHSIVLYICSY